MMGMNTFQSEYGDAVDAEKAPEIINNEVSTLPPEQLYELTKQMKECVQVIFINKLIKIKLLLTVLNV